MRVYWTQRIALTAIAASALALLGAEAVRAQFAPYGQPPQTEQSSYGYGSQSPYSSPTQYSGQTQNQYSGQIQNQYAGQSQNQYSGQYQNPGQGQYSARPQSGYGYVNPTQPQQTYMAARLASKPSYETQPAAGAYNPQQQQPVQQSESRYAGYTVPPQADNSTNVSQQASYSAKPQAATAQPQYTPTSYAAMEHHAETAAPAMESAPAPAAAESSSAVEAQAVAPSYQGGYMGYNGGCYNSYNTFDHGCGDIGYGAAHGCGCGHNCLNGCGCGCGPRWFGGVYGLLMERDRSDYLPIAFSTDTANTPPYYAGPGETNFSSLHLENEYQGGLEFRLGMYCGGGCGGCGTCGGCGGCGCGPTYGAELVYWGLFEDDTTFSVSDVTGDTNRLYSMIDWTGYEYDPGDGYRPMNVFWDYGSPTSDYSTPYDVEIRSFSGRTTFSMQNLEANLLRLPVLCGGGACCGGCGLGNCGMGGCGGCDSGCGGCGSCGACGCMPRYSVVTVLGTRIMRLDDDFWLRSDYERMDTNALGWLAFNSETDNTLYGGQLGCRGTYCLGATGRFAIHCASTVGLFANHIEVAKWVDAPTGDARYISTGDGTYVENDKDDVSVLGELRLGASYCVGCNCRVYAGWRVVGITGVALATDQIQQAHVSPGQDRWIDSEGSILVHGLQAGMQFNY